jgi:hypothetical protein
MAAKRPKQACARALRASSIVLLALAGILPMLTQLEDLSPFLAPVWASVLVAMAGACVALDRFFGYSSAWIRYINAALQLRQIVQEFNLDWQADQAAWRDGQPDEQQVQRTLARCKAFVTQVGAVVRDETALWIAEFQDTLKQLDETVRARETGSVTGGLIVTVTNGEQCGSSGWTLSLDDGPPQRHSGKTAALTGVVPGLHRLTVVGTVGAQPRRAESAVQVAANGLIAVDLELS